MFDRDAFNSIKLRDAATGAMTVIDAVQDMPVEQRIVAVASTFILLAERFGVDPQDAFSTTSNIMHHAQGRRLEFEAVREYLKHEV